MPLSLHIRSLDHNGQIVLQEKARSLDLENTSIHCRRLAANTRSGEILVRQFEFSSFVFQWIEATTIDELDFEWDLEEEAIFLVSFDKGYGLFKDENNLTPIGQTQIKFAFDPLAKTYHLKLTSANSPPYSFFALWSTLPSDPADSNSFLKEYLPFLRDLKVHANHLPTSTPSLEFNTVKMELTREITSKNPNPPLVEAYVQLLLLATLESTEEQILSENLNDWDPERKATYLMAENIILSMDEPWPIKKMALTNHVNSNKLKTNFKKHIGQPAAAFKISVRMQKAKQLITETNLSIQEISAMVGYTDPAQFSTMFKRKMGCSPRKLRKGS